MTSLDAFDYVLPAEQIAQQPVEPRDHARLLCVGAEANTHHRFDELPTVLASVVGAGALLVFNDTRVIPARLHGHKIPSGGKVELLLCDPVVQQASLQRWRCMARPTASLHVGQCIQISGDRGPSAQIVSKDPDGMVVIEFSLVLGESFWETLERVGQVPIPPYIRGGAQRPEDHAQYQTVYARAPGAVAAPTAGLHFTAGLLQRLRESGFPMAFVTLHVGPGTFAPIKTTTIESHVMHAERYVVSEATVQAIAQAKSEGRPVVAVGTTVTRALEAATPVKEHVPRAGAGETRIFIYPPYTFRCVDAIITNFHLPRSTLLMLVCAFGGTQRILDAYNEAVREGYRFFSYGDAMLLTGSR